MASITQVFVGQTPAYKWTLTTADPTGQAIPLPEKVDATIQAFGTFGGGTVSVDLSCEADAREPTSFFAARNFARSVIAITSNDGSEILQRAHWVRPKLAGSTGGTVTVYLLIG